MKLSKKEARKCNAMILDKLNGKLDAIYWTDIADLYNLSRMGLWKRTYKIKEKLKKDLTQ